MKRSKNKMKKLKQKIKTGIIGTCMFLAFAGNVFADTKSDLKLISNYVKTNPTKVWNVSETGRGEYKTYELENDNFNVETSKYGTLFYKDNLFIYDKDQDGKVDRIILLKGPVSRLEKGLVKEECMENDNLDMEIEMNKMAQHSKGKTNYNTRQTLDANTKELYDFGQNKIISIPEKGVNNMQNLLEKFIEGAKKKIDIK